MIRAAIHIEEKKEQLSDDQFQQIVLELIREAEDRGVLASAMWWRPDGR